MLSPTKIALSIAGIILLALLGYLSGVHSFSPSSKQSNHEPTAQPPHIDRKWGKLGSDRPQGSSTQHDDDASELGAIPGQRSIKFVSQLAMEHFLRKAGGSIRILDRMDALHTLRVGYDDSDLFAGLLDGSEQMGMIFPAYTPDPNGGTVQANAVPLGKNLLQWLGLDALDPSLGQGIKIAILDTGVAPHPAYGDVKNIYLTAAPENPADWNGHGTAAASLIIGNTLTVPGAAPGAELTSWRVADDSGTSDSWKIAQAIIQAVDAGNQIISLSMGSYGDSTALYDSVQYAVSKGVIIVASSGNDGKKQSSYPASYTGVIAATAIDAQNNHLLFSNLAANQNGLSAPGWKASAAWPGDQVASFSGTSASAPIVAGEIASVMSHYNITAPQAYNVMISYANETGSLGYDPQTGAGAANLGRIFRSTTPNVSDAAVASQVITPPTAKTPANVQINIQNQGTVALRNVPLNITTPAGSTVITVPSIAPNQVASYNLPLQDTWFQNNSPISVSSTISQPDNQAANNQRTTTWLPAADSP